MIDLYSDTQTRPTPGMRAAMAGAVVGDEQADGDPTTLALCARVAGLLGKEAGLLLPSGTMCNLIGVLVHTRPGDEVVADAGSHLYCTEAAGGAAIAGVSVWPVQATHGVFGPAALLAAIRPAARTAPRTTLVSVEQTTFNGGEVWDPAALREVATLAHAQGLATHLDGARLLNAVAATEIPAHEYALGWDSAWIDLSKGLGCPMGGVLCGSQTFVEAAWRWKVRLGGAMRQSGVLAAAGLYALDHHVGQLQEDQDNAHTLWSVLSTEPGIAFDPPRPRSNILRFTAAGLDAVALTAACARRGVRLRALDARHLRATTHLDVTRDQAQQAADAILAAVAAVKRDQA